MTLSCLLTTTVKVPYYAYAIWLYKKSLLKKLFEDNYNNYILIGVVIILINPLITIGDIEIWRVIDMETAGCIPIDTFPKASIDIIKENQNWLYPDYIDSDNNLIMAMQSFVIKSNNKIILIEGGVGNDKLRHTLWANKRQSPYVERLNEIGLRKEDVGTVLTTHMHMDHVGWFTEWSTDKWTPTFPNARYIFVKKEYEYWKNTPDNGNLDTSFGLIDSIEPVMNSKQADFVGYDYALDDRIYFEPAPGHTPGQVVIHIKSKEKHLIIAGDIFHHPIQTAQPDWTADYYDVDTIGAEKTRIKFLNQYADSGVIIIGAHFGNKPAGIIEKNNQKIIFKPV